MEKVFKILGHLPEPAAGRKSLNLYHSQIDHIFPIFPQKTGSDISCKLSPLETICMKCHILFSGKNKIFFFSNCCLLKILPRVLSVNAYANNKGPVWPAIWLY